MLYMRYIEHALLGRVLTGEKNENAVIDHFTCDHPLSSRSTLESPEKRVLIGNETNPDKLNLYRNNVTTNEDHEIETNDEVTHHGQESFTIHGNTKRSLSRTSW